VCTIRRKRKVLLSNRVSKSNLEFDISEYSFRYYTIISNLIEIFNLFKIDKSDFKNDKIFILFLKLNVNI
jgi:hypothetical protein